MGSLFCLGIGRLVDRVGSRLVVTALALGLGPVVLAMGAASSVPALLVLITLTRGLGQSALSVVSPTMVGKWFARRLSAAMGVYAVVIERRVHDRVPRGGRRGSLARMARGLDRRGPALVFGLAPLAWLLARRTPEAVGLMVDGGPAPSREPDAPTTSPASRWR